MTPRCFVLSLLGAFTVSFFASCSSSTTTTTSTDPTVTTTPPTDALIAGQWCYDFKDNTLHLTAVMEYDGKTTVTGTLYGDIQDTVESYFTSYVTTFNGIREGGNLKVKTRSEIEGDVQEEQATWAWDGKTLTEGLHKMAQVNCEPGPDE